MQIDRMTLARARLAIRRAVGLHLFDPNVNLIDLGYPEHEGELAEEELAIRFHVHEKLSGFELQSAVDAGHTREIPKEIDGFKTDVPQASYRPHQWSWGGGQTPFIEQRANRFDPLSGGISISDEYHNAYGTLGGIVRDRATGVEMLLSNWHVLVADWWAPPGQRIYQPGRLDGGNYTDAIATLTRHAMLMNLDAAVATLTGNRKCSSNQLDLGPVTGVRQVDATEQGLEVTKSGRRTSVTVGKITGVNGFQKLTYRGVSRVIQHVIAIDPLDPNGTVSGPGDSGAWWLDKATNQAIGLHFAGSEDPQRALAIDMQAVLDALNIDIAV